MKNNNTISGFENATKGSREIRQSQISNQTMRKRIDPVEFKNALEKRTKEFAVAALKLLDALPKKNSTRIISYQLGKSASSIGANYREANRAESRDDFVHKLRIALKEASESCYWLEVLSDLYPMHETIKSLGSESIEIRNLFQSITRSASSKSNNLKS